ncbi:hypothetical protein ACU5DF_02840 [Aliivibrio wodanis]|uniref:hypothetical protein n=1 Tax=Aliivibrio wodanis TaxID=80852 RepID=UPI00406C803D
MTINTYLDAVDSAVIRLLEARMDYQELIGQLFTESLPPIFCFNRHNPRDVVDRDRNVWENKPAIKEHFTRSSQALEALANEQFALSIIDGSLLQIACKGFELYSENEKECLHFSNFTPKVNKLAVGELIRDIPSGLIIYAGRNHYNHLEEGENLRRPTKEIIHKLIENKHLYKPNVHLDFYNGQHLPQNLATHFIELLGWKTAADFRYTLKHVEI